MSEVFVCSNCGSICGKDSRGGSLDVYLTCKCAENYIWYNDGQGGYPVYQNNATPIRIEDYRKRR